MASWQELTWDCKPWGITMQSQAAWYQPVSSSAALPLDVVPQLAFGFSPLETRHRWDSRVTSIFIQAERRVSWRKRSEKECLNYGRMRCLDISSEGCPALDFSFFEKVSVHRSRLTGPLWFIITLQTLVQREKDSSSKQGYSNPFLIESKMNRQGNETKSLQWSQLEKNILKTPTDRAGEVAQLVKAPACSASVL